MRSGAAGADAGESGTGGMQARWKRSARSRSGACQQKVEDIEIRFGRTWPVRRSADEMHGQYLLGLRRRSAMGRQRHRLRVAEVGEARARKKSRAEGLELRHRKGTTIPWSIASRPSASSAEMWNTTRTRSCPADTAPTPAAPTDSLGLIILPSRHRALVGPSAPYLQPGDARRRRLQRPNQTIRGGVAAFRKTRSFPARPRSGKRTHPCERERHRRRHPRVVHTGRSTG